MMNQICKTKFLSIDSMVQVDRPPKKARLSRASSSPVKHIADLAAAGTSNFMGGDFNKARACFSEALCSVTFCHRCEIDQVSRAQALEPCQHRAEENDVSTKTVGSSAEYDEGMNVYTSVIPLHETSSQDKITAILCYNIAQTYYQRGQFVEAHYWFNCTCLKIRSNSLVSNDATVLLVKTLNCLGHCSYKNGDNNAAIRHYKDALAVAFDIQNTSGTGEHAAAALNCIGVLLFNRQSNTEEVLNLFQKSLQLFRASKEQDVEHVMVATVLNNVGRAQYLQSAFLEALKSYEEALKIRRTYLGNQSIDVAATIYNIGQAHQRLGNHDRALKCFLEFLEIAMSAFGENSRDVALVYKAIADIHKEKRDLNTALHYLEMALDAQKTSQGQASLEVATTFNKLGNLCYEMKDFRTAMAYYKEGLRIEQITLPYGHCHIMITMTNIAHIYKQLGDYHNALSAHKNVLAIQKKASEFDGLQIAESLSSIGLMEYHLKDYNSAFESYQEALQIRRRILGTDDSPDIASTLNSIGLVLFKQNMLELSKKCFNESLRIRTTILGKDHRDVAITWYNLATIHFESGEDETAIEMYKETLRVERAALGDDHPDVVLTLQHLGQVFQQLGHVATAIEYFDEALEIERRRAQQGRRGLTGRLLNLIGNAHLQLGQTDNMMRYYIEASRIYETEPCSDETLVIAGYNLYGLSRTNPPCAPLA